MIRNLAFVELQVSDWPAAAHAEVDDGGPQRVGHADHHARISVQRVEFVARRVGRGRVVDRAGTVVNEVFPESRHGVFLVSESGCTIVAGRVKRRRGPVRENPSP